MTVPSHRQSSRRPRYGRISLLLCSVVVTGVALLGGLGIIPSSPVGAVSDISEPVADAGADTGTTEPSPTPDDSAEPTAPDPRATGPKPPGKPTPDKTPKSPKSPKAPKSPKPDDSNAGSEAVALPAESGTGYRVVYSEGQQRVWLVEEDGTVARTYLVSGSVYENLEPGTYQVYSRSEDAVGIDDSGTMKYFVRFTEGWTGAAIGFHDIPIDDGERVQSFSDLGTPQSHGCIRQRRSDAKVLWDFAPIGTTVVVTT